MMITSAFQLSRRIYWRLSFQTLNFADVYVIPWLSLKTGLSCSSSVPYVVAKRLPLACGAWCQWLDTDFAKFSLSFLRLGAAFCFTDPVSNVFFACLKDSLGPVSSGAWCARLCRGGKEGFRKGVRGSERKEKGKLGNFKCLQLLNQYLKARKLSLIFDSDFKV